MNDTSRIVATRPSDVRVDEHDGRYEFEIGRGPLLAQLIGRKGERPWTLIIQGSNGHARIWDRVAPDSPEDLARRARLLPQRDRETGEAYARSLAYKYREVVEGSANTPTRVALRLVESPSPPAPQSPGLPSVDHHDHADHTDRIDHAGSEHRGDPVSGLFPGAWDDADAPDEIKQLNNEYAVVMEGGRGMIWRPSQDQDRIIYERLGERDFQLLKKNQTVEVSVGTVEVGGQLVPKTKLMPLAKYWLEYPKRRTYEHVIFDPTPDFITPADTLNLWRGFAVQPTPGRWDRFDAHLCEVICGGDDQK
jgi:hypothetical protein